MKPRNQIAAAEGWFCAGAVLEVFPEVSQQGKVGDLWLKTSNWLVLFVGKMLLSGCRDFWKDILIYSQGSLFYRNGVNVLWRT